MKFKFPTEPILEWKVSLVVPKSLLISPLKARKYISKGCIYHLVWVKNYSVDTFSFLLVPVVNELTKVFTNDILKSLLVGR